jgi:hypothetical protein
MPVYVLVGGALPEREKAQAQVMAMRVAARRSHLAHMPRTEVLQVADQWRAVWWFSGPRADADRLRAVLAAQGLRVEVVEM